MNVPMARNVVNDWTETDNILGPAGSFSENVYPQAAAAIWARDPNTLNTSRVSTHMLLQEERTSTGTTVSVDTVTSLSGFALMGKLVAPASAFDIRLQSSPNNIEYTEVGRVTEIEPGNGFTRWFLNRPSRFVRAQLATATFGVGGKVQIWTWGMR